MTEHALDQAEGSGRLLQRMPETEEQYRNEVILALTCFVSEILPEELSRSRAAHTLIAKSSEILSPLRSHDTPVGPPFDALETEEERVTAAQTTLHAMSSGPWRRDFACPHSPVLPPPSPTAQPIPPPMSPFHL
jgi:hypothetical protein